MCGHGDQRYMYRFVADLQRGRRPEGYRLGHDQRQRNDCRRNRGRKRDDVRAGQRYVACRLADVHASGSDARNARTCPVANTGIIVNAVACSPSYNASAVAAATYELQLDAATDATTE